ncbi:glycosyltransferase family 2 protein [Paenibacillus sp. CAU 1782]
MQLTKRLKLTVIIPVYNVEQYLRTCLESVLSQTLNEIEIICINDGSTDHSLSILKHFQSKYEHLIVIDQENKGVGNARNQGLALAKGEFVAFMDPDDYYPNENVLELLYVKAKEQNVLICGGSFSQVKEGFLTTYFTGWRKGYTFTNEDRMNFSEYQYPYAFSRYIYNVDLLKREHILFPTYTRYQDVSFLVEALTRAEEFYAIPNVVYCYRVGHKAVELTPKKTLDWASGVLGLLKFSRENKLNKVHRTILNHSYETLYPVIYKYIAEGDKDLLSLAIQINESIDLELLSDNLDVQELNYFLKTDEIDTFTSNIQIKEEQFLKYTQSFNTIILYGAGRLGVKVAKYLKDVGKINMNYFAVSSMVDNPNEVMGIPVRLITELTGFKEDALVIISTYTGLHSEISHKLSELNFKNVLPINAQEFQLFGSLSGRTVEAV